jgi:hypothetical protein
MEQCGMVLSNHLREKDWGGNFMLKNIIILLMLKNIIILREKRGQGLWCSFVIGKGSRLVVLICDRKGVLACGSQW